MMWKYVQRLLCSPALVASITVLVLCAVLTSLFIVLTWLVYEERYGLTFAQFLEVAF